MDVINRVLKCANGVLCKCFTCIHLCACRLFTRDKRKVKTQVKQNTLHPSWDEDFQLLVHEPQHQLLNGNLQGALAHLLPVPTTMHAD